MKTLRLTLAILLFAGIAAAHSRYESIDTKDFVNRADEYQGRLVAVSAELLAVNADGKSIRLFDPQSKALIEVDISQLRRAQRTALMLSPVHYVSVYGKAEARNGKLVIEAHQVVARSAEDDASR